MMVTIWRERIQLLGVIDTGQLIDSVTALHIIENSEGKFLDFSISHEFKEYGIWQDLGVGKEVYRGNDGDIGRDKVRKPRRWMSPKYYSSTLNLRDFMADSVGLQALNVISHALTEESLRESTSFYQNLQNS